MDNNANFKTERVHDEPDPRRDRDPRHEQELDTVAQKPTHIGEGAPTTRDAVNADEDNAAPIPGAQPPEDAKDVHIGHAHQVAAGLPAVYQSARFTMKEMGFARGMKTWLTVNKKDGFDCQSCAWPSPGRGPARLRVLRERRESRRGRGDAEAHHAGVLPPAFARRPAQQSPTTGSASRAA